MLVTIKQAVRIRQGIRQKSGGGSRCGGRYAHHDLPGIGRQVSIIERPIELLFRSGLVRGVVVRCKVLVLQTLFGRNPFPGVEYQHLLEEVDG